VIKIKDLSFAYPGGGPVLESITLAVKKGALLCLAGVNGSGKSSLLLLLAGLLSPDKGSIQVNADKSPGREKTLRQTCGLLLQDADLQILGATVEEDLLLGTDPKDKNAREKALDVARNFKLDTLFARPVQTLSWGQKKKLCLAATLIQAPKVLLLDEPLSGLDYPGILEMRSILVKNQTQGLTQVIAAHDLEPVADLADFLAVLHKGKIRLFGPPKEVLDKIKKFGVRPPCSWNKDKEITPWE